MLYEASEINKSKFVRLLQPTLAKTSETGTEIARRANAGVMSSRGTAGAGRQFIAASPVHAVRAKTIAIGRQSHGHVLSSFQICEKCRSFKTSSFCPNKNFIMFLQSSALQFLCLALT